MHFDHEAARILQACGLGEALPEISESGSEYEWRNAAGQVLLRFGGRPNGPSGWPDANMFWQPALERLIELAAVEQPSVEVRRGWSVVGLDDPSVASEEGTGPSDSAVTSTLEPQDGGDPERLRARYVVGCDGANSTVRDLMGIGVTDLGFFYDWLIVDVALHQPWPSSTPSTSRRATRSRPDDRGVGWPGAAAAGSSCASPDETVAELATTRAGPGSCTGRGASTSATTPCWSAERGLPVPGPMGRALAPRAGAAGRRRRAPDAAVRRAGHVLGPARTRPTWRGSSTWCSTAARRPRCSTRTRPSGPENVRTVIDFSMSLGKVICVTDPDEARARDDLMASGVDAGEATSPPPLPGVTSGVIRDGDPDAGARCSRRAGSPRRPRRALR